MLVLGPKFVEGDEHLLKLREVGGQALVSAMALEIVLVEGRCEVTQFLEVVVQLSATLDHVFAEHILLSVDPEVVEGFLGAVEDLG